jgi:predicted RNase H-like nuclease
MIRSIVVLPQPDGPTNTATSPRPSTKPMSRSTSSRSPAAAQDKLDATICALVGMLWRSKNRSEAIMVGNAELGYMIAPAASLVPVTGAS